MAPLLGERASEKLVGQFGNQRRVRRADRLCSQRLKPSKAAGQGRTA
jgi:hypothetical protein